VRVVELPPLPGAAARVPKKVEAKTEKAELGGEKVETDQGEKDAK
jgi:hypothetical protein